MNGDGRDAPWYWHAVTARRIGFWMGPAVFAVLLLLPPPPGLSPAGWRTLAAGTLMAVWWITEAVPLAATSLLPLVLFPALGVMRIDESAAGYAHPLIFLFMGGFMLALAMERWRLHRRIALAITGTLGTRPAHLVGGFMAATAFLSMWMSNTATAVMMLPIGVSVLELADRGGLAERHRVRFGQAMVLGIAYAASIGGLGTLIGTPPNALFAAYLKSAHGVDVSFARWMLVGVPLALVLLPLAWLLLVKLLFPLPAGELEGGAVWLGDERRALGPLSRAELGVAMIFGAAGAAWVTVPLVAPALAKGALSDTGIAMGAAFMLFLLPSGDRGAPRLLDWETAAKLPWGVLILFGGGLSLADALSKSGLASWAGTQLQAFAGLPFPAVVLTVALVVTALSELASNTATAAAFLPLAAVLADGLGRAPVSLALPVALAASCGFMLPVATPPNTLAYGTGRVSVKAMIRAGFWLDLLCAACITAAVLWLGPLAFP